MRLWMVPLDWLCDNHLRGEHIQCHMFAEALHAREDLTAYYQSGVVDPMSLRARHDRLAEEMLRRGFGHHSPLPTFDAEVRYHVDVQKSKDELMRRCPECAANIRNARAAYTLEAASGDSSSVGGDV